MKNLKYSLILSGICLLYVVLIGFPQSIVAQEVCSSPDQIKDKKITYDSAEISWKKVKDAASYILRYRDTSDWQTVNDVRSNKFVLEELIPGTAYEVQVSANCKFGEQSEFSDIYSFSTLDCSPARGFTLQNLGYSSVEFKWQKNNNVLGFTLCYKAEGVGEWVIIDIAGPVNRFVLEGLAEGTRYEANIQVNCSEGIASEWSELITFTTLSCLPPAQLRANQILHQSASLRWQRINSVEAYLLNYREKGQSGWQEVRINGSENQYDLFGLNPGITYEVAIISACESGRISENSSNIEFTTLACSAPDNFSVTAPQFDNVTLGWRKVAKVEGYNIQYRIPGTSFWEEVNVDADVNSIHLENLREGADYEAQIQTRCTTGLISDYSELITFSTIGCLSPENLRERDITLTSALVIWQKVPKVSGYSFTYQLADRSDTSLVTIETVENQVQLKDLVPGTDYIYQVQAICQEGMISTPGAEGGFSTLVCSTPENLRSVHTDHTRVTMKWHREPPAESYNIRYRLAGEESWKEIKNIVVNAYDLSNLVPGSDYEAVVNANCEGELYQSEYSLVASFRTKTCNNYIDRDTLIEFNPHENNNLPILILATSYENNNLDGVLDIEVKLYFGDTLNMDSTTLRIDNPGIREILQDIPNNSTNSKKWLGLSQAYTQLSGTYLPGDSAKFTLQVRYNKKELPFHPQILDIFINNEYCSPTSYTQGKVYVYFTPYNTVEVWNDIDFNGLKRIWQFEGCLFDKTAINSIKPLRKFVSKDSIPESNLSNDEFENEEISKTYYSVDGLAYSIPVRFVSNSIDRTSFTDSKQESANKTSGVPDCDCGDGERFRGTITGKITAFAFHDDFHYPGSNFYYHFEDMTGLEVQIIDHDGWPGDDDLLGTAYTDDEGNFTLEYCTCQANEDKSLELYLRFKGWNQEQTVQVRRPFFYWSFLRAAQTADFKTSNKDSDDIINFDFGKIQMVGEMQRELKPQLLHWAHQCRKRVEENVVGSQETPDFKMPDKDNALYIYPKALFLPASGNFFMPGGYKTKALILFNILFNIPSASAILGHPFSNEDCIYISETSGNKGAIIYTTPELDEDIIYHEFGHYMMWRLQNRLWVNDLGATFSEWNNRQNMPNLSVAWTEGWANGWGFIMDGMNAKFDKETIYRANAIGGIEVNSEDREYFGSKPEEVTFILKDLNGDIYPNKMPVLTLGLVSPFNIGCYIYDLWDGQSVYPNEQMSFWDDGGMDCVELSLSNLCKPLYEHRHGSIVFPGILLSDDVHKNIIEYCTDLISIQNDCENSKCILNLANHNALNYYNIENMQILYNNISGDEIKISKVINWYKYSGDEYLAPRQNLPDFC